MRTHVTSRSVLVSVLAVIAFAVLVIATFVAVAPRASADPASECRNWQQYKKEQWAKNTGRPISQAPYFACPAPPPPPIQTTVPPTTWAPGEGTETPTTTNPGGLPGQTGGPETSTNNQVPTGGPTIERTPARPTTSNPPLTSEPQLTQEETGESVPPSTKSTEIDPLPVIGEKGDNPAGPAIGSEQLDHQVVSDPTTDGCKYCGRTDEGVIEAGPANSIDGWTPTFTTESCPAGMHKKWDPKWSKPINPRCYTDYDYNIVNVRVIEGVHSKPGDIESTVCVQNARMTLKECNVQINKSTSITTSVSTTATSEKSAKVGAWGAEGSVGLSEAVGESKSIGSTNAVTTWEKHDMSNVPPGQEIAFYQQYKVVTYQIQKVDTRTGQIVETRNAIEYIPLPSVVSVERKHVD